MQFDNPVMENLMTRASVRRFTEQEISEETIAKLVRAGQQAPFTGQMYSVIVTKDSLQKEKMAGYFGALPRLGNVFMLICVDFARLERFIKAKGRENSYEDQRMMIMGIQDAAYFAQNIVTAAESYGIGSVFLGRVPWCAKELKEIFKLPNRVWPMVGLVLGYKAEQPPPRPRIPLETVLHCEEYKELDDDGIEAALQIMDAGLLREGYYESRNAKVALKGSQEDRVGYDEYGWGEHISRKYGQGDGNTAEQGRDIATILQSLGINLT